MRRLDRSAAGVPLTMRRSAAARVRIVDAAHHALTYARGRSVTLAMPPDCDHAMPIGIANSAAWNAAPVARSCPRGDVAAAKVGDDGDPGSPASCAIGELQRIPQLGAMAHRLTVYARLRPPAP
jgi:hypothetical protein